MPPNIDLSLSTENPTILLWLPRTFLLFVTGDLTKGLGIPLRRLHIFEFDVYDFDQVAAKWTNWA